MLVGFTNTPIEPGVPPSQWKDTSRITDPEVIKHSYNGSWLGRSCGASYSPTPIANSWGILVISGEHDVPPCGYGEEQTDVVMTKNGQLTINSVIAYVP